MSEPTVVARSTTADGFFVVAWSTGAISPSRLVAAWRGMEKGPLRHHQADALAAVALVELAGSIDKADMIAALPTLRERWRNAVAGGSAPTAADVLLVCGQCRTRRMCG